MSTLFRSAQFARARLALALTAVAALAGLGTAVAPAAAAPASFFGISPQTEMGSKDYAKMSAGKIGTLRVAIPWSVVDSTAPAGGYDWSFPDSIIAEAARHNITVLPVLYATPGWVAKGIDHQSCSSDCFLYAPRSKAARGAWQKFVGAAVDRYGPGGNFWEGGAPTPAPTPPPTGPGGPPPPPPCLIPLLCRAGASAPVADAKAARAEVCGCKERPIRVWQIWNEQNSSSFYKPKPNTRDYAALLKSAAGAIRPRDRQARIILGGMPELAGVKGVIPGSRYLTSLYRVKKVEKSFDGVSSHPYAAQLGGVRKQVMLLRRSMKRAHDAKASMWVTEIGWGSEEGGNPLNRGVAGQAESLSSAYSWFLANRGKLHVKTVVWFTWQDSSSGTVCQWCGRAGLFDQGFSPKPSWNALTKLTGGS